MFWILFLQAFLVVHVVLNPFMLLLRVLLLCAGLSFSFRDGLFRFNPLFNQRVVALLNAGCRKVLPR